MTASITSATSPDSAATQSGLAGAGNAAGGNTAGGNTTGGKDAIGGGATGNATGNAAATALDTLLTQNFALSAQPTGTTPASAHGSSMTASSPVAGTATATAAALTAAQLTGGSAMGLLHGRPDPGTMTVGSPVGSNAWADELGTKVTWMAHQGIESASLQLSPEHLGPMQVTISVRDGQASVWFGAAQPDTRAALQQSLPQLRQLFASQGLTLSDAGVSRESPRGQDRQKSTRTGASIAAVSAVNLDSSSGNASSPSSVSLVDTYV